MSKFHVQCDFLNAALTGYYNNAKYHDNDDELISHFLKELAKFNWTRGSHGLGAVYLTYLAEKLFNIHRYPCFADIRLSCASSNPAYNLCEETAFLFCKLDECYPEIVNKSLNTLRNLYEKTQKWLSLPEVQKEYNIRNNRIQLYRGINHALDIAQIYYLYHYTREQRWSNMFFFTNILVSFSKNNGHAYLNPNCPVYIKPWVHIKDILMVGNIVENMEYDEWIVVNHHPMGKFTMPRNLCIIPDEDYTVCGESLKDYCERLKHQFKIAQNFYKPLYLDSIKPVPHKLSRFVRFARKLEKIFNVFRKSKSRLSRECARLDPQFEQDMAEEQFLQKNKE